MTSPHNDAYIANLVNTIMAEKIRILVVDDSPIIRRAVTNVLEEVDDIEVVGLANDGEEAIKKYLELKPDVVTMDVIMPKMDGLSALKVLANEYEVPVIMLSGVTNEGAKITFRALELGAVDFIPKPKKGSVLLNFQFLKDELTTKIRAAVNVNMDLHLAMGSDIVERAEVRSVDRDRHDGRKLEGYTRDELFKLSKNKVVVIGASTGGPKALEFILAKIKGDFPAGVVVAQHMPQFFTHFFAERLGRITSLVVSEAQNGDVIEGGKVLVAPGNFNIKITKSLLAPQVELETVGENERTATPSIDTLFYSAAATFGKNAVGVILTGMGRDGSRGLKAIKIMGGKTIAQDEKTSLVYGMPKSALENGAVSKVLSIHQIPAMIQHSVYNRSSFI